MGSRRTEFLVGTARAFSTSVADYWKTVALIVNYVSFIDQLRGNAPDPRKVSGVCGGLTSGTGGHNSQRGGLIQNCVVDLDTNEFVQVTFKNSVIRYHGGPVALVNVQFVNCSFDLTIPADTPSLPSRDRLLLALLDAPSLQQVKISSTQ